MSARPGFGEYLMAVEPFLSGPQLQCFRRGGWHRTSRRCCLPVATGDPHSTFSQWASPKPGQHSPSVGPSFFAPLVFLRMAIPAFRLGREVTRPCSRWVYRFFFPTETGLAGSCGRNGASGRSLSLLDRIGKYLCNGKPAEPPLHVPRQGVSYRLAVGPGTEVLGQAGESCSGRARVMQLCHRQPAASPRERW